METLATFYEDVLERKNIIKECLETGNLSMYATHVHALNSAAGNIGADELAEIAETLEMAGKREDLVFIESRNGKFLTALESLLGRINDVISARKVNRDEENRSFDKQTYKAELIKLRTALENMDAGVINETVDILKKISYTEDYAAAVRNISNNVLIAEYDEAVALIESLLREVQR